MATASGDFSCLSGLDSGEQERAGHALESAGGALERATESFEPVVQRHEYTVAAARAQAVHEQRQKALTKEREYPGPSLEL